MLEGLLVVAAGRRWADSRPPALARPRRGDVDLPDGDAPERDTPAAPAPVAPDPGSGRRRRPASNGLTAIVRTVLARATLLI